MMKTSGADVAMGYVGPVVAMVEVRVAAADSAALLDEALAVLTGEARELAGFLAGEVLGSVDGTSIKIVTEWVDRHAWARSRYDRRVGLMLEHCNARATSIDFELYVRRGIVPVGRADARAVAC